MKTFSKAAMIFTLSLSSTAIAQNSASETQERQASQYQEQIKENKEKPYTGWMLDAINGANSPEQYRVKTDDDLETRLKKQLINASYTEIKIAKRRFETGDRDIVFLLRAYRQLIEIQDEFHADDLDQRIKVARDMTQYAKSLEANVRLRTEQEIIAPDEWAKALGYRLQCELRLLQLEKQKN